MKFGTIGAGAVALAFGREALARGHEVVLSSRRGPEALADKVAELGRGASAASVEEAAHAPRIRVPVLLIVLVYLVRRGGKPGEG
jgi:predicted dinucleotide-binding enzyme